MVSINLRVGGFVLSRNFTLDIGLVDFFFSFNSVILKKHRVVFH
jgi:hypothetical protein